MPRPSEYSEEIADKICELIIDGYSMIKICDMDGMPHRITVMRWLEKYPDFATRHAYARELQGDFMDDRILDVADHTTAETAAADRVKIAAYQWRAAKLRPKKYGDKLQVGGADDLPPVRTQSTLNIEGLGVEELEVLQRALSGATNKGE